MIAYCSLRQDYRNFRMDNISDINATGKVFEKQHPLLKSFLNKMDKEIEMHTINISVESTVLKYFGEQKYYNGFVSQKTIGDRTEMTFVTASLIGFTKFFLLFGEYADIISPASLKDLIKKNMFAILKRLK